MNNKDVKHLKLSLVILFFILISSGHAAQTPTGQEANLDFETLVNEQPAGWHVMGKGDDYVYGVDQEHFQRGKTSVFLDSNGQGRGFKAWSYAIPAHYQGSKITLKGYLKTENVRDGWAGLWLRLDPNAGFDNMKNQSVVGTRDWQQYEISLDFKPQQTNNIVIGGLLVGSGKMWLDNLELLIDDKPYIKAPTRALSSAQKDREFDQGSTIEVAQLNERTINNLALLGKIWGFLKYHHPAIASGAFNWDYQLFRILPRFLGAKNNLQRDQILLEWIDSLGKVEPCSSCQPTTETAFIKPDLRWLTHNDVANSLQTTLLYIYHNRSQNKQYYVEPARVGTPNFTNENAYSNMVLPDDGFSLLALYRYWNMIHYFFPYKYLTDKDWGSILVEYIPQVLNVNNRLEYELVILKLIGEIHDTHANLLKGAHAIEAEWGDFYPPVMARMIENKLVVSDFYTDSVEQNAEMSEKVGLKIGDIIISINGMPVKQKIQQLLPYYPASNYSTKLHKIAPNLLRSKEHSVAIEYQRNGDKHNLVLGLYKKSELNYFRSFRKDPNQPSYKILADNVAYVTLENIQDNDIESIKTELKDTKGMVIDIRNYPSTFVVYKLGSFFMHETTPFTKISKANFNNPGEFSFVPLLQIPTSNNPYRGKLVVLVNEFSISQSEFTAMAFKAAKNTTILGSTTAGADGNVSSITLPGGLYTSISGTGIYYPDGSETQRVGIVPDIFLSPTIEGIKSGKDELLDKAIEIINNSSQ